ncbi:MAG: SEC-C domain-containing protein [Gallionellaceae bacterium]|nr:MAG: SEC-C domain-containing protein [Gallionellaceae bacterium]
MTTLAPNDDLEFLLQRSVAQILKSEDPAQFLRWFEQSAEAIAPNFFSAFVDGAEALRGFKSFFARYVWNRTHLPGNHFRPLPLPKPERNAPCVCGSGLKYKQCCLRMEAAQNEFPNLSMLPYVLDALTAKQRADLPYAYLSAEELAHVARQWMEEGRAQDAAKLLEGLFRDVNKLDDRAEAAFDCLLDCYDILGNPQKKKKLLERGTGAADKRLRAAAMQRQCCILADRNEYAEAWALFQDLQRLVPNDPSLSHLEITILLNQGEQKRAAERATFWVARLSRDPDFGHGPLIEFLRGVAQGNVAGAMGGLARELGSTMNSLTSLIDHLPPPEVHYTLRTMEDSAGPLMSDNKLQGLIAQWEVQGEFSEKMEDDIEWLQRNPLAWSCFEILDEWLEAVEDARISHGFESVVLLPVLRHAEALLRLILKRYQADGLKLEWGWHENRPALRVMQRLVSMSRLTHNTAEAVRVAEWMVLTLNPNDNQGMREGLLHNYLRLNRVGDALALAAQYPHDMAAMEYGKVLALVMDKQMSAAQKAMEVARKRYPEVAKMLLAAKPKQPRLQDGLVQAGGKDEAWYYRQDYFDLWQTSDALSWLQNEC